MDQKKNPAKQDNKMRNIKVDKLILNLCTGESGDKLTKAAKVLEDLSDQKPVESKAKYSIRSFGIKRNEKIAVHVTVRGEKAEELIKRGLKVKEYELRNRNFSENGKSISTFLARLVLQSVDDTLFFLSIGNFIYLLYSAGNFGFGIDEHIDLGIKYDTSTGIFGMDFTICLKRPGDRVSKRKGRQNRVGKFQRVTRDDAKLWFIETLGGTILN